MTMWSAQERSRLATLAPLGIRVIRQHFQGRSDWSIRQKAIDLGVKIRPTRNASGATRWRGKIPIPPHVHPLVKRLVSEMNAQRATLREVADSAGLRFETISDWRYSRRPTIDNFIAALNVLGLDLAVVRKQEDA